MIARSCTQNQYLQCIYYALVITIGTGNRVSYGSNPTGPKKIITHSITVIYNIRQEYIVLAFSNHYIVLFPSIVQQ
jgi:hypothetical protein